MPHLCLEQLEWRVGWPVTHGQVRREACGLLRIMALPPRLNTISELAWHDRHENTSPNRRFHSDGTVSFAGAVVQPANREPLSAERFLTEAAQLHQTWIRRFDAQHRRRPRPPEIEAERLRLVRRLQLVQRLQQEVASAPELLTR